jgi:citronellol/citronellal dehydrogenase
MNKLLKNKTIFISGASRGIGRSIALRAAMDGANIVIAAKTAEPHPALPGTVYTVAKEVEAMGGKALPIIVDVRNEQSIEEAVNKTIDEFGGLDILINNASAISLTKTENTPSKRFDLMFDINVRGSYLCSKVCIPHLKKSQNPHILSLSPPLNLQAKWFAEHTPYTMSKFAMSMLIMGLAEELKDAEISANALWPKTIIATSALKIAKPGFDELARTPEIMSDAAYEIITSPRGNITGRFYLDEEILRERGVSDFSAYLVTPGIEPMIDLFVEP